MARWRTVDDAIREAAERSPLRAQGIDNARVPTTSDGAAVAVDAYSRVVAILGRFDARTQLVLIGWAMKMGYEQIAREGARLGIPHSSRRTLKRIHRPAWEQVRSRLLELDLIERA